MLRAEDNRFLTKSGAGTGMGELLRRFWMPVLLSEELPEADGEPKKIVVMGEELLAFRDTRGVVGVIDQYCPHRGANLWLGRNEECGIRCVYHGWKFDTDGALRRHAHVLSRPQRKRQDPHQVLSGARMGRHDLGLYGPAGGHARTAAISKWRWCRPRTATSPRNGRTATGCRRWKVPSTPRISPSPISPSKRRRTRSSTSRSTLSNPLARVATDHMRWIAEDPRPVIKVNPHEAGLDGRRRPADRRRQHLLAHRAVPDAVPFLCAELDAGREHFWPDLRAGHRHQLLDLHLRLESGAAADASRARGLTAATA